jgi:hypothetical protein
MIETKVEFQWRSMVHHGLPMLVRRLGTMKVSGNTNENARALLRRSKLKSFMLIFYSIVKGTYDAQEYIWCCLILKKSGAISKLL